MAISYPIALASFFDGIGKVSATFTLPDMRSGDITGGGDVVTVSTGPALWQGSVTIRHLPHITRSALEAKLELVTSVGASFLLTHPDHCYPSLDPTGSILGASAPKLAAVAANNRDVTISGLPSGYKLSAGDFLSFTYGSSPTRYALHRIVNDRTASGAGSATLVEVNPPIRAGWATNVAVTLKKPICKAVIMPQQYTPFNLTPALSAGASFAWGQTLR